MADNWQCPHCGHHMVVSEHTNMDVTLVPLQDGSIWGTPGLQITSVACSNRNCRKLTIYLRVARFGRHGNGNAYLTTSDYDFTRRLVPEAALISLPEDVPVEIAQTYREAVLISDLSGRASAAMARRCLQGIVRDFWSIPENKRGNLGAELSHIRDRIDPELWEDIQAVRSIGDIGAHMDKNVNEVIDVSPEEARILIQLIENLFQDWYIQRAKRRAISRSLRESLAEKREQQKAAKGSLKRQENDAAIPDLLPEEDNSDGLIL